MLHKNFIYRQSQQINEKNIQTVRSNSPQYFNNTYLIQKNDLNYFKNKENIIGNLSDIDQLTSKIATQINQMKINNNLSNEPITKNHFNNSTYSFDAISRIPNIKKTPKQYLNIPGARVNKNFLNQKLIEYIETDKPINSVNNFSNNNNFFRINKPLKKNLINNISMNSFNLSNNIININSNKKPLNLRNKVQKMNYITHKRIFSTGIDTEIIKPLDNFEYKTNNKKCIIPKFQMGIFDSYFVKSKNENKNEINKMISFSVLEDNNNDYSNDNKSTKPKTRNFVDRNSSFSITSTNNTNKNISKNNDINISPFLTLDCTEDIRETKNINTNEIKIFNNTPKKISNIQDKNNSDEKKLENKLNIFERSIEKKTKMDSLLESIRQKSENNSYYDTYSNNYNNSNNNSHSKNKKVNRKKVQFCTENIIIRFEPEQCVQNLIVYNSHGKKQIKKLLKTENYLSSIKIKNNKKSILKNCDANNKKILGIDNDFTRIKKIYSFNRNVKKIKIKNSFFIKKNLELKKKKQENNLEKQDKILSNEFINQIFDYSNLVNEEKSKIMNNYSGDKKKSNLFLNNIKDVDQIKKKNQIIVALKNIENYIEETI